MDAGRAAGRGEGQALVFARTNLGRPDGTARQSVELAFGARQGEDGATLPALRLGASWGRGLETRWGPGWIALDGSATGYGSLAHAAEEGLALKLDTTLGVRPGEHSMVTLQVFWSRSGDEEAALRVVPSYARRLRGETFGQIGIVVGTGAAADLGIKFGLFREF